VEQNIYVVRRAVLSALSALQKVRVRTRHC
jgi:hypothetical protein